MTDVLMNARGKGTEWSPAEQRFLIDHNDDGIYFLMKKLKRSRGSINGQRKRLRLKVTRACRRHNEKELADPIRAAIRNRRKAYGWSQREVSVKLGMNEDWFGQMELGKACLTDRMLLRICQLLHLKVELVPTVSATLLENKAA